MLNDKQRKIFSEVLDLNWDCDNETDPVKKKELVIRLRAKKTELKDDMGEEAYDNFMSMGQKMFS